MTPVVAFYNDCGNPYSIRDIIENWTDEEWETRHDFIQWIFPSKEPSMFNADAPILTEQDIIGIQDNILLFKLAFKRFIHFLGLEFSRGEIVQSDMSKEWIWKAMNHNWLRITRCLQSSRLMGLDRWCCMLFDCLLVLKDKYNIADDPVEFWVAAATPPTNYLTNEEIEKSQNAVKNGDTNFVSQNVE